MSGADEGHPAFRWRRSTGRYRFIDVLAVMINLRFHIVSLVAVFLALAIGIAVGATVVDQGLLSQSQRRISSLDKTLQDRAASIKVLRADQEQAKTFAAEAEPRMVRARLLIVPVVFVSDGTVDEDAQRGLVATLRASGARLVGVINVSNVFSIASKEGVERARIAVGASSTRPDTIRFLLRQRVVGAISAPDQTAPLQPLVDAGFVQVRGIDGTEPSAILPLGTRVIFLDRSDDDTQVHMAVEFLGLLASAKVRTLVVGASENSVLRTVRKDRLLRTLISTVDGTTSTVDRAAVVYSLEDLGRGIVGHYGTGENADRLLPAA